jgi:outer membrane biosynthesis protein TonB
MKLSAAVVRFLLEAAFIVAVAAATAVARLDKLWIALAVGAAWALVTLVERSAKHGEPALLSGPLGFLFMRGGAAQDPAPEPEPPAPLPDPPPAPEPAPPAPEPEPRRPEPEQPTPQLRSVPPPPPEPERTAVAPPPPQPPGAPVLAFRPRTDGDPREWNVWELERIAHERQGEDVARDEELAFLLLELRQFANADGQLPASFDPVVRDTFGESLFTTA